MKKTQAKLDKKLVGLLISVIIIMVTVWAVFPQGPISDSVYYPGTQTETVDYLIFREGSTYYSKNGSSGAIVYSGSNCSEVVLNSLNALPQTVGFDQGGGIVHFKEGTYEIDTQLKIPWHRIALTGSGIESTVLDTTATVADSVITFEEYTYGTYWNRLEGFTIDGYSSTTITGIDLNGVSSCEIRNVRVRGFTGSGGTGIHFRTSVTYDKGCYYNNLYNVYVSWCETGIKFEGNASSLIAVNANNIHGGWVQHCEIGLNFTNAKGNVITALNVEEFEGTQGYWFGAHSVQNNVLGGWVEDTGVVTGFNFTNATDNTGNAVYNVRFYLPSGTEFQDDTTGNSNIWLDALTGDFKITPALITFDDASGGATWAYLDSWYGAVNTAIFRSEYQYFVPIIEPDTSGWGASEKGRMWFCSNHSTMEYWDGTSINAFP